VAEQLIWWWKHKIIKFDWMCAIEEYISKHDKEIYIHNLNNDFYTGLFQTTCVGR
jgi:hypothetical protein